MEKAQAWSLPLEREGIYIERGDTNIRITVRYRVVVNLGLPGGYERALNYRIDVARAVKAPYQPIR